MSYQSLATKFGFVWGKEREEDLLHVRQGKTSTYWYWQNDNSALP